MYFKSLCIFQPVNGDFSVLIRCCCSCYPWLKVDNSVEELNLQRSTGWESVILTSERVSWPMSVCMCLVLWIYRSMSWGSTLGARVVVTVTRRCWPTRRSVCRNRYDSRLAASRRSRWLSMRSSLAVFLGSSRWVEVCLVNCQLVLLRTAQAIPLPQPLHMWSSHCR